MDPLTERLVEGQDLRGLIAPALGVAGPGVWMGGPFGGSTGGDGAAEGAGRMVGGVVVRF